MFAFTFIYCHLPIIVPLSRGLEVLVDRNSSWQVGLGLGIVGGSSK
jgi:hypothetical protein